MLNGLLADFMTFLQISVLISFLNSLLDQFYFYRLLYQFRFSYCISFSFSFTVSGLILYQFHVHT